MRLDWNLASVPTAASGYRTVTEVVGTVSLIVDQAPFVTLEDILILEFANFVENWLTEIEAGEQPDFYYRSMDEEEEPLLALSRRSDGTYSLESCWSSEPIRAVESSEAVIAFKAFSTELKGGLRERYGVDIGKAFSMLG